jgi:UDP-glucose 4-epimerase
MSILVTGGAGYVGSHTVRLLYELGHDVVVLDNLRTGSSDAVVGADLVVGDIRDSELVTSLAFERHVDTVIHFAGYKAPGESMDDPGRYFDNNVSGTLSLLLAVERAGVRQVVFSSSCAVYGNPDVVPVPETSPVRPASPYGESKHLVERMLRWFDSCRGITYVSLRYFNAAGASFDGRIGEDWRGSTNLVPLAAKAIYHGPPLLVRGMDYPTPDGTAVRDYVHVADLADAHSRAVAYLTAGGRSTVLNLGTGQGSSVLEVLEVLGRIAGRPVPWIAKERRAGDPAALWADSREACRVLGWRARYGLNDVLETAWRWHSSQARPPSDSPTPH